MSEPITVRLTGEQLREVAPLLNMGVNVVAEIRLASIPPGSQSAAYLFVKQIDKRLPTRSGRFYVIRNRRHRTHDHRKDVRE